MIDATPIPQPERERPDLYVGVWPPEEGCTVHITTLASRSAADVQKHEDNCHKGLEQTFRLPGTRREKAVKELMESVKAWVAAHGRYIEQDTLTNLGLLHNAEDALSSAYTALAELDAKQEGEK